jgi:hypothetical protein
MGLKGRKLSLLHRQKISEAMLLRSRQMRAKEVQYNSINRLANLNPNTLTTSSDIKGEAVFILVCNETKKKLFIFDGKQLVQKEFIEAEF